MQNDSTLCFDDDVPKSVFVSKVELDRGSVSDFGEGDDGEGIIGGEKAYSKDLYTLNIGVRSRGR